jgi:hypothetical protein
LQERFLELTDTVRRVRMDGDLLVVGFHHSSSRNAAAPTPGQTKISGLTEAIYCATHCATAQRSFTGIRQNHPGDESAGATAPGHIGIGMGPSGKLEFCYPTCSTGRVANHGDASGSRRASSRSHV